MSIKSKGELHYDELDTEAEKILKDMNTDELCAIFREVTHMLVDTYGDYKQIMIEYIEETYI